MQVLSHCCWTKSDGELDFDGLSVALVVEYIDNCPAEPFCDSLSRADQATPPRVFNCQRRSGGKIKSFYAQDHSLRCDDSYGIEVARLAGLPRSTIIRAKQILKLLESGKFSQSELGKSIYRDKVQPSLFDAPKSEVENRLKDLDLNGLSPVAAFDLLRRWKEEIE